MEKIYKTRFSFQAILFRILWAVMQASVLAWAFTLLVPGSKSDEWILPVLVITFLLGNICYIAYAKSQYLLIKNEQLTLYKGKTVVWTTPISEIKEIDNTQSHIRRTGLLWFREKYKFAFLLLAGGNKYAMRYGIEKYDLFLEDLKQLNPSIQLTDLTQRSGREYMASIRQAEARNEYHPDDPFSKVFGKWLPPQVIVWGAVILIVFLVALGIYYTVAVSKY